MKVKVGQKVTFRSDLVAWKKYGVITMLAGTMLKEFNGKTYTVVSVLDNGCFYVNSPHPFILSPEMLAKPQRVTIEVYGNKTVAKVYDGDKVVKVGVAKCSPNDAFDFATGVRIAFDRIYGEKTKPKQKTMHIVHRGYYYGEVGKPTELKDINDEALFVGDMVELFNKDMKSRGLTPICSGKGWGDFVMGIAGDSSTKRNHGEIKGGWKIIKRKSHEEARVGDSVNGLKIVAKSEAYNE